MLTRRGARLASSRLCLNCVCGLSKWNCWAFTHLFIYLFENRAFFRKRRTRVFSSSRGRFGSTSLSRLDLCEWLFEKRKKRRTRRRKKRPICLMGRFHFLFHSTQTSSTLTNVIFFQPPPPTPRLFPAPAADSWPSVSSHLCLLFIDTNKIERQIKNCHQFSSRLQRAG